jgi:hypothetical protein
MKSVHPQINRLAWLIMSTLLLGLLACGPTPPTRKEVGALPTTKPHNPTELPMKTTDDLVVYLDTSSPMKGFVQADGQSVFSRTLRTLREFATTLDPPVNVSLRTVDLVVGPLRANSEIVNASTNQNFYTGAETNLAEAIGKFSEGLQTNPSPVLIKSVPGKEAPQGQNKEDKQEISASTMPPPRFHVLVTDGVQYSQRRNSQMDCASGSDAFCVRKKILELMDKKWAGAILGIRSQFCCAFFSEKNQRPVAYDTRNHEAKEYRPFYLYIFSPDHEALGKFVERFKESLRTAVDKKELVMRELALTQNYASEEISFAEGDIQSADRSKLKCAKVDPGQPIFLSLRLQKESRALSVPCQLSLKIPWTQHALDGGTEQELAALLQWEIIPVYPVKENPGHCYPLIKLNNKPTVDEKGQIIFQATVEWSQDSRKAAWRAYRLVGRLNQDANTLAWVRDWSTDLDTHTGSGGKTLDLTTALLGVWRNPTLKDQAIAQIYLRVGPQ